DPAQSRSPAGYPRPAYPQIAPERTDARFRDFAANPTNVQGHADRGAGLPLPGALSPRGPGLDQVRVGRFGKQPEGEVLYADRFRPKAARDRRAKLGQAFGSDQFRLGERVRGCDA